MSQRTLCSSKEHQKGRAFLICMPDDDRISEAKTHGKFMVLPNKNEALGLMD